MRPISLVAVDRRSVVSFYERARERARGNAGVNLGLVTRVTLQVADVTSENGLRRCDKCAPGSRAIAPLCTRAIFDYGVVYWDGRGRGDAGAAVIGTEIPSRSAYKLPLPPLHFAPRGPQWLARMVRAREGTRAIVTSAVRE